MDQTKQHTEFNGSVTVDLVTGKAVVPETVKDVDGNDVEVATNIPGKITWDKESDSFIEIKQPSITLGKDDKYATSDDMVGTWHQISGKADKVDLTPDSSNPADEVLVYEKDKSDTGIPMVDPEKPAVTIDQETKTFTRTIVYRGTKNGGKTYEDVNGSPDGTHEYKQTVTFTRNVLKDKDGNILSTTNWKSDTSDMPQVDSKDPKDVGYDKVDVPSVDKLTVDPKSSTTDLGKTVVTYTTTPTPVVPPVEETYHVTVHYVDTEGNVIKNLIKDSKDYKNGENYDENNKKDTTITYNGKTYEFVKVQDGDKPAGTIEDKDVDVTYVYRLKKDVPVTPNKPTEKTYNVTVHYVDEDGNVIKNPVKDDKDYKPGEGYDENSKKDSTISYNGKTYEFVKVQDGDKPAGTIEDKDIDVTYVYKLKETPVTPDVPTEKTYNVTVHYVDEDGNVIKNPVKDDKDYKPGEGYDENSKKDSTISYKGKTYEFVKVQDGDNPAGTIEDKDVDVTYVYKLKKETPVTPDKPTTPEPSKDKHQTTVEYVTEDGKQLIPSISGQSDLINGSNFNNAQAKKETITVDGKTYKLVAESNVSNKIAGKDQVTRFVYKEVIPNSEDDKKNVEENHSSDHTEPSAESHNVDMPAQEKVDTETKISKPSKQDGQQNVVVSTRKLSSNSFTSEKQQITGQKSNTSVNKAQSKRTLPQTGAKQNTLAYVGIGSIGISRSTWLSIY